MASSDKVEVAVVTSKGTRDDPDSSFLNLFRNNADYIRDNFRLISTEKTAKALLRTGFYINDKSENDVEILQTGTMGIIDIANRVVQGSCKAVVFLYNLSHLSVEPSEVRALQRICIAKKVPLLTTIETAAHWLRQKRDFFSSTSGKMSHRTALTPASPLPAEWTWTKSWLEVTIGHLDKLTIALISHDGKKPAMMKFVADQRMISLIKSFGRVLATGTTGRQVIGTLYAAGYVPPKNKFWLKESGPLGGDIEIAKEIIEGRCQVVIFFQDPISAHPHDPDISLLRRACLLPSAHCILLSDEATAERWLKSLPNLDRPSTTAADTLMSPGLSDTGDLRRRFQAIQRPGNHTTFKQLLCPPRLGDLTVAWEPLRKIYSNGDKLNRWPKAQQQKGKEGQWRTIIRALANVGCRYVDQVLRNLPAEKRTLAITWGRSMQEYVRALEEFAKPKTDEKELWHGPLQDLTVTAGCGQWDTNERSRPPGPNELIASIARVYGTNKTVPLADPIFGSGSGAKARSSPSSLPSVVVTSISILAKTPRIKELLWYQTASKEDQAVLETAANKNAIGIVGGVFINKDGAEVKCRSGRAQTGLGYDDLREIVKGKGHVVAVVGGDTRRDDAIVAALKGGLCNVLITDPFTRDRLLSNWKYWR